MKKLAFVGNSEPPERLLELFRKFTPGNSGVWGQLEGIDNYRDADYFAIIDFLPWGTGIDTSRSVFLGAHPPGMVAYQDMTNQPGFKKFDCKNTFGFGEWWLKYDYDYLSNLQPPGKTDKLCCIMSDADRQPYHAKRKQYLERFCNVNPGKVDVYGRLRPFGSIISHYKGVCGSYDARGHFTVTGNDHMSGKEEAYEKHQYALEFDAPANGGGYFSERIFDSLLLWCSPIYWGCNRLGEFLPKESFSFFNIDGNGEDVMSIINSNVYESKLLYIKEARELLLNKYQIWPRVHEAIFGVCK